MIDQSAEILWTEHDSSNIKRVGYHENSGNLFVEFRNGGLYGYHGVDVHHYYNFVGSESVGKYLNNVVKVLFPYTRFESEEELLEFVQTK